ncbi:MAG TPA: amidohydrolase family protein [Burkholderiales bacterium]|jgi:predicted amidohydrolase YtcJ|nr:amidohydrolase family protein [Burkholderiales bacterium]
MSKFSRRDLFKATLGAGLGVTLPAGARAAQGGGSPNDNDSDDLVLVNGRIHTMDEKNPVVSAVAIRNGRFVAVGSAAHQYGSAKVINLGGRTVVPGLIESHTHFVSLANRPGYHVAQWELASSVAEVLALLAARRRDVPPGQFITAMGAGTPRMFAELRLPTLQEIDSAVPDRPVFLYQGGGGPARTNSLGKAFFESATAPLAGGCTVAADGTLAGAMPGGIPSMANRALYHLRIRQTFDDKKRSALDAMAYSASIGITAVLDQTLVARADASLNPALYDPQPTDALFTLNHYRMYDAWLSLHRDGVLRRADTPVIRLQMNFLHNQGFRPELPSSLDSQLPELRERLKNQFPFHGDDLVRTGGIGEWAAPFALPSDANNYAVWYESQRLVAKARWRNENAQAGSIPPPAPLGSPLVQPNRTNIEQVVSTYEAMDREFGITDLRWGLQHAEVASADQLSRLKALNCGVSASGFKWLNSVPRSDGQPVGPYYPVMVDSGIPLALHEDGVHIAPHNPWFAMHYATTGLNVLGQQINTGQQISREQALHMYTRGAAWYLNRENDLGSIEEGKLGDLVVLDRDYFSVSDAQARRTTPVLTVVGGKVVYDAGVVR